MTKLIYLLWPKQPMAPAQRRHVLLEQCAPKLLALDIEGLQVNITDDRVTTPSPSPKPLFKKLFVAQVNVWVKQTGRRDEIEALLRQAGFAVAGYQVDEWLYSDYGDNPHTPPRDWPDGERSPGILAVTLLFRPTGIAKDEWMRRWFGWQSPMSEWMQPRTRYVRNLVESALTPDAPGCEGIVEEGWPSGEHVTNKRLFFGARNHLQLLVNMTIMLRSVTRMLRLWNIMTVMMSEYFIKTPKAPA
jgi:hypothetical protein